MFHVRLVAVTLALAVLAPIALQMLNGIHGSEPTLERCGESSVTIVPEGERFAVSVTTRVCLGGSITATQMAVSSGSDTLHGERGP